MATPKWFEDTKADFAATLEMEWIEPNVVIFNEEVQRRERDGWRLIDQTKSQHPRASKEYGRHWARDVSPKQ